MINKANMFVGKIANLQLIRALHKTRRCCLEFPATVMPAPNVMKWKVFRFDIQASHNINP